ncbi:hypothetical protein NIES4102_00120 [Chondrocystis sp. NIES-4102]|nr:hypothetical protein NIES4102_00120 [Chondrocystis sp. NIES-4102]
MIFNHTRRIYLGDTDAAGVVYFAQLINICHEAYEESLAQADISLQEILQAGEIALPVTHAEIDFFLPLFCNDQIQITLVANLISQSEFAIAYKIYNLNNLNQLVAHAQTRHVCINPQVRKRIDLPAMILAWLENNK